jgi:hypothetical protein
MYRYVDMYVYIYVYIYLYICIYIYVTMDNICLYVIMYMYLYIFIYTYIGILGSVIFEPVFQSYLSVYSVVDSTRWEYVTNDDSYSVKLIYIRY